MMDFVKLLNFLPQTVSIQYFITTKLRGIRDFIELDLVDFAQNYPGIVVYIKPRRHRSPCFSAEYLNGEKHYLNCHNFSRNDIHKWINLLRTQSGNQLIRYRKLWHTDNPSIQGPWSPFVNRRPELNLAEFPNEELSRPFYMPKTATDRLREIFEEQQRNVESLDNKRAE
ncbi:hypothetical protein L9F63_004745 [Diploptera punctata]|uniref:Large ribosomal subunit protein mL43 n=1 Tax=Diploptera punctata TaxID=6984 RepID=A0AAD7ZF93_DIPPU|nr:hypothetical protein L9F63_004745 [Diploptera punctata]